MKEFWLTLAVVAIIGLLVSIFLDRVVNPWQRKRSFAKFSKDFSEGKIKPHSFSASIIFDAAGVVINDDKSGERSAHMLWSEVVKVVAYKRDLFSVDRICVFLSRSDETGIEIHEDLNNWMNFITSLPKHLSNCKPMELWLENVMLPPFTANVAELYSRQKSSSQSEAAK